jgi:L-rhamnose isomerase
MRQQICNWQEILLHRQIQRLRSFVTVQHGLKFVDQSINRVTIWQGISLLI